MKNNFLDSNIKVKELLNKLLKKHLDKNLSKLEINSEKELKSLSLIKNSSNKILDNLLYYSNITHNKDLKSQKFIKIPKLTIHNNNINNKSQVNINKKSNPKKKVELTDSILKKRRYSRKNSSSIYIDNNNNVKTKVSFIDKSKNSKFNITPERIKRNKTFFNHTTSSRREKHCLNKALNVGNFTIERIKNNKIKKKIQIKSISSKEKIEKNKYPDIKDKNKKFSRNNNSISFNYNNTNEINNTNKKGFNTAINFYSKKNNSILSSIDKYNNRIIENEKNLKFICDSVLFDVNKDELLINYSKKTNEDNFENENLGKQISLSNKEDIDKNKNYFYDKFKIVISYIIKFLSIQDVFNLFQTNKEILKIVLNIQIQNTKQSINTINTFIKDKNINLNDSSLTRKNKPFELNINSVKAIALLNTISKANFIKSIMSYKNQNSVNNTDNNNNIKKILLIFDIYFISIGKKKIINSFNCNDNNKIENICNYFKNNKNKSIGTIIENDLNGKKFDDYIINSLYECSHRYINIINPTYYKKINKDIAIFVFLIKNILDYIGLNYSENIKIHNNVNSEQKILLINKSRINIQNILLDKYNHILNKFN